MKKPIQKILNNLTHDEFYVKHLQILNPILNVELTGKEIEVLAGFMALKDTDDNNRFDTRSRKIIMKKLNQSSGGLGNHLKALKDKGFIYDNQEGYLVIREFLIPDVNTQSYQFKLQKKYEQSTA